MVENGGKKNGWRGKRREKTYFMLIIMDGNATMLTNALGSTVAIPMFLQNLGIVMGDFL
jgi:hypothetical protein